jgi:hypothetical protein
VWAQLPVSGGAGGGGAAALAVASSSISIISDALGRRAARALYIARRARESAASVFNLPLPAGAAGDFAPSKISAWCRAYAGPQTLNNMVDGGPPKTTSAEVEEMKVAKGKSDAKKTAAEIKAKKAAV